MTPRSLPRFDCKPAGLRILTAALLALSMSACARKVETTGTISAPYDYRERHPVVLRDAPQSLDVFVGRAGLDPRQSTDVADFAAKYRARGRGALIVQVPSGDRRDGAAQRTLASVRSILSRNGISGAAIAVSKYQASDPGLAAPLRLTFASLQAQVPHACGQWPDDLGATHTSNWRSNEPSWNLGCASQATLAAQIADPIDLVRARPEGVVDTTKRSKAIEKFRNGTDPSTLYTQRSATINTTVGAQ